MTVSAPRGREDAATDRDLLVLAKTIAANDFPVERSAVIGVDRETGEVLRLAPFPWRGADTDPPVMRWGWIQARVGPPTLDPRPESRAVAGAVAQTAYLDAKDGWRLRWPFVRPHVHASVEALLAAARSGAGTIGFVRPAADWELLLLPLRVRFRCGADDCAGPHELPVLDWELHEMARASRERHGQTWATRFRESWGPALLERFDVHVLVSTYAQAPSRPYLAGLFHPPREREDPHAHAHHAQHRAHLREERADPPTGPPELPEERGAG